MLGYLFEHVDRVDPEALTIGLENLYIWFQDDAQLQRAREGFLINNLPENAVARLDDEERSASGLEGITVATKSHFVRRRSQACSLGKILAVLSIIFRCTSACFGATHMFRRAALQHCCGRQHTRSAWAGIVEMESKYTIQFRWVETQYGWMMLQRFWLKAPVDGDKFDVKMKANYYVGVIMDDGGRSVRPVSPAFRRAANGVVGLSGRDIDGQQEALSQAGSLPHSCELV